jgi:hypothetical protein
MYLRASSWTGAEPGAGVRMKSSTVSPMPVNDSTPHRTAPATPSTTRAPPIQ